MTLYFNKKKKPEKSQYSTFPVHEHGYFHVHDHTHMHISLTEGTPKI